VSADVQEQLRHVVEAATLAPSVHNTQPWRFRITADGFELRADRSRQLHILDPAGRQLTISCGAAIAHAEVAARGISADLQVDLLPEPDDADLLARVHLLPGALASVEEVKEAEALLRRHTSRERYDDRPLPAELAEELRVVVDRQGAMLRAVADEDDLIELEVLLSGADAAEERDPEYRAELRSWVHPVDSGDGIPAADEGAPPRASSLRLRDFSLSAPERLSGEAPPAEHPAVVVLTTDDDRPESWLRAGRALGRMLLHAAATGVQAQPLGQITDLESHRRQLARRLGLVGLPQLVLRLGYVHDSATAPRRPVEDVLDLG
jgi:nitroreductase